MNKRSRINIPDIKRFFELAQKEYNPSEKLLCEGARSSAYISPEGRLMLCGAFAGLKYGEIFPFITEKSLSECLSSPEIMNLADMGTSDLFKFNEECRTCKFSRNCYVGCRAGALIDDENNLMGKVPSSCELHKGGWVEKIIDTIKKVRPSAELEE